MIRLLLKSKWLIAFLIAVLIFLIPVSIHINRERILNQFSEKLYKYFLPPKTTIIEKTKSQAPNYMLGWGNNDRWDVVATMKLSTKLKKEDIIQYYKNIVLPYANYSKLLNGNGVPVEVLFKDESERIEEDNVIFYEKTSCELKNKMGKPSHTKEDLIYILQIRCDY